MWEHFVEAEAVRGLSPGAQKVFVRFLNLANRSSLHPLDWRRFYGFVRYAHAHRARMNSTNLSLLLQQHGFSAAKAESLAFVYGHGRKVLGARCPAVRGGKVYG